MTQDEHRLRSAEWLEADGLGGFASGPVCGPRTRRYHALLAPATTPPTGRMVLVNGLDAFVETSGARFAISTQRYAPDVSETPSYFLAFSPDPWPTWRFRLEDGTEIEHQLFSAHGRPETFMTWRRTRGAGPLRLLVRPFFSGRDHHALHHENPAFELVPEMTAHGPVFRPYRGVPAVAVRSTGCYHHDPHWYRSFRYREEEARGLDDTEDLAAPGVFELDLEREEAALVLRAGEGFPGAPLDTREHVQRARGSELERRRRFASPLDRAADSYLVARGDHGTIIAGYPWFTDWGRDTFIALRGLALATRRLDVAREILLAWSGTVSEGMLPNRFPDRGGAPEYNSVDASLWYVIAVYEYLETAGAKGEVAHRLVTAVDAILDRYTFGARYGIRADRDGLLSAGEPGVQLTWMDAKVGDFVVTPRIGKPVEVQALWLNALRIGARWTPDPARSSARRALLERGLVAFPRRFVRPDGLGLYDVVDVDHVPGTVDARVRPNQIFAVGGLPFPLLEGAAARAVVDLVERALSTPLGLRSLAPFEPGYRGTYEGGVLSRDTAYHQGTVWPWLNGPFVDAWLAVRGRSPAARAEAQRRFVAPLLEHLSEAGLGHVSEIADAEPPHTPRGCPFQAWSLGELIRALAFVGQGR